MNYLSRYPDSMKIQALEPVAMTANAINQDDLLDALGQLRLVELAVNQARRQIVAEARTAGHTWQEIGDTLGTSRQAAQERYGRTVS